MKNRKLCQWLFMLLAALFLCGSVTLITNTTEVHAASNQEQVFTYLTTNVGLNAAAACGIMANIQKESSFNPEASGSGGKFYGICQWGYERKTALYTYCSQNGYSASSLEGQLHYLEYELRNGYSSVLSMMQAVENSASGAYEAGYNWCYYFERPGNIEATSAARGALARDTYWPEYGSRSVLPFVYNVETEDGTVFSGKVRLQGWAIGAEELVKVEARINGATVSGSFASRADVDAVYSAYAAANKGFYIEILPANLLDGQNTAALYAYDSAGNVYEMGSVTFQCINLDRTAPVVTDVAVSDVSADGYTITCTVTDESGIDRVLFPTWTEANGQDDILQNWENVAGSRGTIDTQMNTVTFRVKTSAHNYESGAYITHIYAYDACGNLGTAIVSCEVPEGARVYGDVDGNGAVDTTDAMRTLQYVTGIAALDAKQLQAADVDASGAVDAVDALEILEKVVQLIDAFPAEK